MTLLLAESERQFQRVAGQLSSVSESVRVNVAKSKLVVFERKQVGLAAFNKSLESRQDNGEGERVEVFVDSNR